MNCDIFLCMLRQGGDTGLAGSSGSALGGFHCLKDVCEALTCAGGAAQRDCIPLSTHVCSLCHAHTVLTSGRRWARFGSRNE